jgi:hypothetical protein
MEEFVPEDIAALIASIEAKQDATFQARKRAEDAEHDRQKKIQALRDADHVVLQAACHRISDWVDRFKETAAPAIWRFESSIVIFSAKFWRGEPAPEGDRRTNAHLRIGGPGSKVSERCVYEEVHSSGATGQSVHPTPLALISQMWHRLHPEFVLQCDAHLAGPAAWKYVRQTLERLKGK